MTAQVRAEGTEAGAGFERAPEREGALGENWRSLAEGVQEKGGG